MKNLQNQEIRLILGFLAEIDEGFFQVELVPINSNNWSRHRNKLVNHMKLGKPGRMIINKNQSPTRLLTYLRAITTSSKALEYFLTWNLRICLLRIKGLRRLREWRKILMAVEVYSWVKGHVYSTVQAKELRLHFLVIGKLRIIKRKGLEIAHSSKRLKKFSLTLVKARQIFPMTRAALSSWLWEQRSSRRVEANWSKTYKLSYRNKNKPK